MPVFIYEPDAFEKLCCVEGPDYRDNQKNFGICSFGAFLEKWKRLNKANPTLKTKYPNVAFDVDDNGAIYGFGGWNRYIVCLSGEILMSWGFIEPFRSDTLWRALEAGFRIWPDEIDGDIKNINRNNKEWWLKRICELRGFKEVPDEYYK